MAEFTFAPLTPASFLDRAAAVFADRTAIIDGERRFTYRELSDRCRRLAGALAGTGAGREDRVAALCANSHVMLELHHAVPMTGAVLVTLNTRLSEDEMAAHLKPFVRLKPLVLICHAPPYATPLDRIRESLHAGSRSVKEFIDARQPEYFFCGHIHEAEGVETSMGRTHARNVGKTGYLLDLD